MKLLVRGAACAVAATALVALPGQADAAPAGRATGLDSTYTCSSSQGSGSTPVHVISTLPRHVTHGATVHAHVVSATITVPPSMVKMLRQYGVQSLSGKATGARFGVGARKIALSTLRIPRTPVPPRGPMTLKGTGSTTPFSIPRAGTYVVRIPASFKATVKGTVNGFPVSQALSCALAKGAPSKIGTLDVN